MIHPINSMESLRGVFSSYFWTLIYTNCLFLLESYFDISYLLSLTTNNILISIKVSFALDYSYCNNISKLQVNY